VVTVHTSEDHQACGTAHIASVGLKVVAVLQLSPCHESALFARLVEVDGTGDVVANATIKHNLVSTWKLQSANIHQALRHVHIEQLPVVLALAESFN